MILLDFVIIDSTTKLDAGVARKLYKLIGFVTAAILLPILFIACNPKWQMNFKPATNEEEFLALVNDPNANIIRSQKDFKKFIASDKELRKVFNDQVMETFLKKLRFDKESRGVITFSYEVLAKIAPPSQYEQMVVRIANGFGFDFQATSWKGECTVAGCNSNIDYAVCTSLCRED